MIPAKLTIKPHSDNDHFDQFTVLFNPTSYSITKPVSYKEQQMQELNAPLLTFSGGDSRTLTLNLFFDVTEQLNVVGRPEPDVREFTNKFVKLTRIDRNSGRPPVCDIFWGDTPPKNSDFPFVGVVTNLTQEFNLFDAKGRPLRATLTVSFRESLTWEEDLRETDPEFTTRVVKRGDSLSSIAAAVYKDPKLWRVIAEANDLDDPRRLEIGTMLNIKTIS